MKYSVLSLRTLVCTVLLVTGSQVAWSQSNLGIGTASPDASALVEMQAANKGALLPRVALQSLTDAATVPAPATSLLVFNTFAGLPGGTGFYYNAGTGAAPAWTKLNTGAVAGDNLGTGVAATDVNLGPHALVGTGDDLTNGAVVTKGVGVRADGGLNLGQSNGNIFLGYQAGKVTTGGDNIFLGYQTGLANTIGSGNQFQGSGSGQSNTNGNNNMYLGNASGAAIASGNDNLFIGFQSGSQSTAGSQGLLIGTRTGTVNAGNANQFMGYQCGKVNTTGSNNLFVGFQSGNSNTIGSNNWGFGYQAGPTSNNLTNAGAIGYNAGVSQSNSLALGGIGANTVKVGIGTQAPRGAFDVAGPGDSYLVADPNDGTGQATHLPGTVYLAPNGNGYPLIAARPLTLTSSSSSGLYIATTNNGAAVPALSFQPNGNATFVGAVISPNFSSSDLRLKQNIRSLDGALASVQAMRGVRYQYRHDIPGRTLPTGEQVGVIAQELEKHYPELVTTDDKGYKAVNYAQLTPVLLEAIKEQQQQIEALKAQASAATQRADRAEASTTSFAQRLQALEAAGARADVRH